MAISRVQAMRPALKDVIDALNQITDIEPYITEAVNTWLDEHPEATTTVEDGSITYIKLATSLSEWLLSEYAQRTLYSSFAPLFTAGAALGIIGNDTESVAWLQRISTADGPNMMQVIRGRTLRWNQLNSNDGTTNTLAGVTATYNGDGTWTFAGEATANGVRYITKTIPLVVGHKYLVKGCPDGGDVSTYFLGINGLSTDVGGGGIWEASVNSGQLRAIVKQGVDFGSTGMEWTPQIFDLSVMFGIGNEPATVAEFESMFPLPYYPYDIDSLLSVHITGIETEDANGNPLETLIIPVSTYFPNGMRGVGSDYDELTAMQAITRIGERAYQSGDENDPNVSTDGTITHYALATPTTIDIDPPLNLTYSTEQNGIERIIVPVGETSAPPTIITAQGYTANSLLSTTLATIAPIEGGTASANYAVDSYLIHDNKLCIVVTSIASGEPIVIGQNVTVTTVMAELVRLTQ